MKIKPYFLIWTAFWVYHSNDSDGRPYEHQGRKDFYLKQDASEFLARCPDCRGPVAGDLFCCDHKKLKENPPPDSPDSSRK